MPPQQTSPFDSNTEDDELIEVDDGPNEDPDVIEPDGEPKPDDVESRLSRAEKREERSSERYHGMTQELASAKEKMARLEAEVGQMNQARQPQRRDPNERFDEDADKIYKERQDLQDEIDGVTPDKMTAERKSRFQERYKMLERKQFSVEAARDRMMNAPPPRNERLEMVKMRYPDVAGDPLKLQMAVAYHAHHHAKGAADDDNLIEKSMAYARKQSFDDDGGNRSNSSARSKYTGGKNAGGGGDEGGRDTYRMQPHDKLMAEAMYPDMDENAAYRAYAKDAIDAQKKNK